jgi:hypothetical protein
MTLNPIRSEFFFLFQHFTFLFYFLCGLIKIGFHVKLTLFCLNSRGFDAWTRGGHFAVRHLPPSGHARRSQERYLILLSIILRKNRTSGKFMPQRSVADPGCFPGSGFFYPSRISDPGGQKGTGSRIRIRNTASALRRYLPVSGTRFHFVRI